MTNLANDVDGIAKARLDTVHQRDFFEFTGLIEDSSVDMILCDLPYGTTAAPWDSVIPLDAMWDEFRRIRKPGAAVVLTAAQPFTSVLVASNIKEFRYDMVWNKVRVTGFLNAYLRPLVCHETILVFCDQKPPYNPQMGVGKSYTAIRSGHQSPVYRDFHANYTENTGWRMPTSVLTISDQDTKQHPTQKPVRLFEYLIRTYSNEGDVVCDPTCGSGTTGVAAVRSRRHYLLNDYGICSRTDHPWKEIAEDRIKTAYPDDLAESIGQQSFLADVF